MNAITKAANEKYCTPIIHDGEGVVKVTNEITTALDRIRVDAQERLDPPEYEPPIDFMEQIDFWYELERDRLQEDCNG